MKSNHSLLSFLQVVKQTDRSTRVKTSGVATGWTGVDMSTALLLQVAPEIDTNPTSIYRRVGPVKVRTSDSPVGSIRSTLAMSVHPTHFDLATPLPPFR